MKYSCAVFLILVPCAYSADLSKGLFSDLTSIALLTSQNDEQGTYFEPDVEDMAKISIEDLSLYVYTRADPNGAKVSFANASYIAELSSFNLQAKTIFYTHGWNQYVHEEPTVIRDVILEASDYNVILVDWDECANSINYVKSWSCVEDTGYYLGEALASIRESYNYPLDSVTLVGHSLGAHISGYAGKYTNGTLGVIVGLDAAFPLFFKGQPEHRLNTTDAQFVQVIHTCSKVLGIGYNLGDADFWPNGGNSFQPGCILDIAGTCSHSRAHEYYAESIIHNNFVGTQCEDFDSYENGDCKGNPQGNLGGLDIDTTIQGDFFLTTNKESPFGQG